MTRDHWYNVLIFLAVLGVVSLLAIGAILTGRATNRAHDAECRAILATAHTAHDSLVLINSATACRTGFRLSEEPEHGQR